MNKQNILKVFNQLIKNIDDYKYVFDFENHYIKGCLHFKIKINKENKLILISKFTSNKITFNFLDIAEEDLKLKDYRIIENIYKDINKYFGNNSELMTEILFKKENDFDGYDFNRTIELYDEGKLEYYINDSFYLDDRLKEIILTEGKEELNVYFDFNLKFNLKKNISEIKLHPASDESFNLLSLVISKSDKLNKYFRNIVKIFNEYPSIFEIPYNNYLDENRNIIELIKKDNQLINNNFCSGKYIDNYSYISITSNYFKNNLYASIGHHIEGYNMNLIDKESPKVFYPTIYTYKDLLTDDLSNYNKDVSSYQRGEGLVPVNITNQDLLVTDLYMLLKDAFIENINYFKYTKNRNYINFHLILTKGKLIKIQKLDRGFIGTNKNDEVILKVSGTTFEKMISSEDLFLKKINSLL